VNGLVNFRGKLLLVKVGMTGVMQEKVEEKIERQKEREEEES